MAGAEGAAVAVAVTVDVLDVVVDEPKGTGVGKPSQMKCAGSEARADRAGATTPYMSLAQASSCWQHHIIWLADQRFHDSSPSGPSLQSKDDVPLERSFRNGLS
mmetsp:Transcript_129509/g.375101  ORF Transcript_129509/g.375101 Transcript_129509/m.375101 type:complete len:104 (+) Transcript_129509:1482-1793(+)